MQVSGRALFVFCLLVPALSPGCLMEPIDAVRDRFPHDGRFYVLYVDVEVLAPHGDDDNPPDTLGEHCGLAYERDGAWHLERHALDGTYRNEPREGPPVVVLPSYDFPPAARNEEGWDWGSFGTEPMLERMPLALGAGVSYDREARRIVPLQPPVAELDMADPETVTNFDEPMVLPVTWTVEDPEGVWRATMRMERGPEPYYEWTMMGCD